jgi:CheY-like chemotaxis protein
MELVADVSRVPGEDADSSPIIHELVGHPMDDSCAQPDPSSKFPLRVLIADDYIDAATSLSLLLANAGVKTDIAFDGEQALELAIRWHPHVCVLDLGMPKLDGREIASRIREQSWTERPLLIALTGWTSAQDRQSAIDAGFDHYLTKPVEPFALVRIIQEYLLRRQT